MDDNMNAIKALEDKYGLQLFGMGLIQLVDVGHQNITDDYIAESIAQITAEGKTSIMTPEFQCEIIRCARELAQFTPMTLFKYIKKHMQISD